MDTHAFKRSLHHSDRYNRRGFGRADEVAGSLEQAYQSSLIGSIRDNDYRLSHGRLKVRLAEAFGFCWGVERAVAMAYETRKHYPHERIWITNEIIHNPSVNDHLREMNVEFIAVDQGVKDFSGVDCGDVVILPAFGATVQEMQLLNERGCHIVDTTCPWVSKVWNTVEKHKKHTCTSIIHGKVKHEETLATSSFAGTYLVVLDLKEAQMVADYILGNGDREAFMAKFANACSQGFDPDRDLERLGVANQTLNVGQFPYVSIMLCLTFGFYGAIRKFVPVDSRVGFTMETTLLAPFALGYLVYYVLSLSSASDMHCPVRLETLICFCFAWPSCAAIASSHASATLSFNSFEAFSRSAIVAVSNS